MANENAIADLRRVADVLETAAMNHEMAANGYASAARLLAPYAYAGSSVFASIGAMTITEQAERDAANGMREFAAELRQMCDRAETDRGEAH